ncbi:MAG TPA: Omp28-related outer membrane protein, partial [bacterium]
MELHINSGYPLYSAEAYQRYHFYRPPYSGGYATPWLWYDGDQHGSYTYSQWQTKIVAEMNKASPFTLTTWGTYTAFRGSGTIYAKFRNDSSATVTGKIRFCLTEDSVYYSAPNGDTWHNHVVRDYLPDTGGTSFTLASGDSITVSRAFTVSASWNENKCEIITWAQSNGYLADSTRDIWQGGIQKVTSLVNVDEGNLTELRPPVLLAPNPCVNEAKLSFSLYQGLSYTLNIYDNMGRRISTFNGIA